MNENILFIELNVLCVTVLALILKRSFQVLEGVTGLMFHLRGFSQRIFL